MTTAPPAKATVDPAQNVAVPRPVGYPALGDRDHPSLDCTDCNRYRVARAQTLPGVIRAAAQRRGAAPSEVFRAFMSSVHARHLAGQSLGTE